ATEEAVKIFAKLGSMKPLVLPDKCNPCDLCGLRCPVGAISTTAVPRVDEEKCISCFACVEFCPRGAFEVPAGQAYAITSKVFS
ncbi:MAG: 4Fe-4S binding protein, partial [Dehalococcoidia bacterium]|nr:4Fe-4S binding protein [Dehalococcoidia bacterium]